jgi:hypothetical protein
MVLTTATSPSGTNQGLEDKTLNVNSQFPIPLILISSSRTCNGVLFTKDCKSIFLLITANDL